MKIWVVLYGDGFEFSAMFIEAYTDKAIADARAAELNAKLDSNYSGYDVEEYELNTRVPQ